MSFDAPLLLFLLLPLVALGAVAVWQGARFARETAATFGGVPARRAWYRLRVVLAALGLLALAVVAARPHVAYTEGGRYLFVVDVSRSMQARFACSEPTFLERAKDVMRAVIGALPQAEFGIVAFDRFAFPVTQMTADRTYLADVIEHGLYVGLMLEATQTEIANALNVVAEKRERLPGIYGDVTEVILLSDGHVEGAWQRRLSEPVARLANAGVRVSAVGIGNPEPTPITDQRDGRCDSRHIEVNGMRVLIPQRSDVLRYIAAGTGGSYFGETETEALTAALESALGPAADTTGRARRSVSGVFVALAAFSFLGFLYLPPRFPGRGPAARG